MRLVSGSMIPTARDYMLFHCHSTRFAEASQQAMKVMLKAPAAYSSFLAVKINQITWVFYE